MLKFRLDMTLAQVPGFCPTDSRVQSRLNKILQSDSMTYDFHEILKER